MITEESIFYAVETWNFSTLNIGQAFVPNADGQFSDYRNTKQTKRPVIICPEKHALISS